MEDNESTRDRHAWGWGNWLGIGLVLVTVATLLWGIGTWLLYGLIADSELDDAARIGDMFGAANALFAAWAFVGVIIAIIMQSIELGMQRSELRDTREELRGQKEQLESQNKTFLLQRFESTFFGMLSTHNALVNGLDTISGRQSLTGRDCFQHWRNDLTHTPGSYNKETIREAWERFYNRHEDDLGHYFRNLYQIFKFIDKSDIEDKRLYVNLTMAQLSASELMLLFYNCTHGIGQHKFMDLVLKYGLFEHLPTRMLIDESHRHWIPSVAFIEH